VFHITKLFPEICSKRKNRTKPNNRGICSLSGRH